jgi:hypothetical protein
VTEGAREQTQEVGGQSHRAAAWLAWSVLALCVVLAVFAILLYFYSPSVRPHPRFVVLAGVPLLVYPTIGAVVVSRRPRNAVGWILCGMGFIFEVLAFAGAYTDYTQFVHHPGLLPGEEVMLGLDPWHVGPSLMLGAVLLVLLFPDGKLPAAVSLAAAPVNRMWRGVVGMAVCGAALSSLWWVTWPGGAVEMLGSLGGAILLISFVVSVFSVFLRLRSAEGRERQQIKWFAYGAAVFLGTFFFIQAAGDQMSEWAVFVAIISVLLVIPVTVSIAILRYRLYDIDILINRTLVYGSLTVVLTLVYFGAVTATQAVFQTLTGQEKLPQLAIVVSTLVIAAMFTPLRRLIQSFIDRRFYRRKYDARKTLEAFSAKLRDETDLEALNAELVGVVSETMQPAHVSLWLRPEASPKGAQVN